MIWTRSADGHKKCIQNFGRETSCKAVEEDGRAAFEEKGCYDEMWMNWFRIVSSLRFW